MLHRGEIAEMRTGEGKTLVAILPAYLNALSGKGVHVVTVNDYLARRDCEWVGQVPRFLGLTIGLIQRTTPSLINFSVFASYFLCLLGITHAFCHYQKGKKKVDIWGIECRVKIVMTQGI